jgi:hypothetical protein
MSEVADATAGDDTSVPADNSPDVPELVTNASGVLPRSRVAPPAEGVLHLIRVEMELL